MKLVGNPPLSAPIQQPMAGRDAVSRAWAVWLQEAANIITGQTESGTTAQRPTTGLYVGRRYFDTTLGTPVWYNGSAWIEAGATLPIDLTADVTGTLPTANGGTGLSETVAFSARAASGQLNVTGNGTVYTVQFTTEIYDTGSDFDGTSTFTAPVDGTYLFVAAVRNANGSITAAADVSRVNIVTSNLTYFNAFSWTNTLDYDDRTQMCMAIAEMDAADTAVVQYTVTGEAGDTVDIDGNATVATTYFQGHLLAPL